ncbi:phospholipase D-like domain-containing protein [Stenotrophobium rhamnosiphilum]|nr:phospholipase D-like domain-containing protein [Stenotrophobium rhamnosiphilum]
MSLIGFDVEDPEPDLVGFSIEVKAPDAKDFEPLLNRLAFEYPKGAGSEVTGDRLFDSRLNPYQKFRWVHFPPDPKDGTYTYRVSKRHMKINGKVIAGTSLILGIEQSAVTYKGLVDVGFTRNFASSQAFREQFGDGEDIIPALSKDGLKFNKSKLKNERGQSVYEWLGFEARDLLFDFLDKTYRDKTLVLDVMAYDLNERSIVEALEKFGSRLRIIIDDSSSSDDTPHNSPASAESVSAKRLKAKGAEIVRTHFSGLQHNKVFISRNKKTGEPQRVLCGSTNFTYRGLYIQANNMLVFDAPSVAKLFGDMFDISFLDPSSLRKDDFTKKWHVGHAKNPLVKICFSPHTDTDLSLNPIAAAVDQATSSVFYSVAFLGQTTKGATREAFDRLAQRPVFSYGTVDAKRNLELLKPDGTRGVVDFAYLASKSPEPFKSEWSGGKGRNIHHKFVVTDFSLPSAKVFTGSSNFSPSGESGNGDHLIMIGDQRIATAYAIEAVRVFDHLHFRNKMRDAFGSKGEKLKGAKKPAAMTLQKPAAISGSDHNWFDRFYPKKGVKSQAKRDRLLFST